MRLVLRAAGSCVVVSLAMSVLSMPAVRAQVAGAAYKAPRTPWGDGKPDLSGIWQAMSSANWDLEDHAAYGAPSNVLAIAGTVGAAPGGYGVVDGKIPYKPEALTQRKENFDNRWKMDPELKCYQPGIPNLRGTVTKMDWINPHAWIHIGRRGKAGAASLGRPASSRGRL